MISEPIVFPSTGLDGAGDRGNMNKLSMNQTRLPGNPFPWSGGFQKSVTALSASPGLFDFCWVLR